MLTTHVSVVSYFPKICYLKVHSQLQFLAKNLTEHPHLQRDRNVMGLAMATHSLQPSWGFFSPRGR